MRAQVIGGDAITRLAERFRLLATGPTVAEWAEIGETLERVLVEDNRKGVLSGLDRDDRPAPPLKYRAGKGSRTRGRGGPERGVKLGRFKGASAPKRFGGGLPNNNLTTAQYRRLSGPRLAPRGDQSRSIANYFTRHQVLRAPDGRFGMRVLGAWKDVLTPTGLPLLPIHFAGRGRNPRYNLAGVRRWGMGQCRSAAAAWFRAMIARRTGKGA